MSWEIDMIHINITSFVLMSMTETHHLKNIIFLQTFVLSRKIIKIYSDRTQKYGNVMVNDFQKYEKLKYKQNKLKLEIDFLNILSNNLCL